MKIRVDVKSNSNPNFHTVYVYRISADDYCILKSYDMDRYDDTWERLCDRIENESVPGTLDPDWYIDHIYFD